MKKLMSVMLGLSLLTGAVAFAAADNKKETHDKERKKHKKGEEKR
jgi:hypothetical protein